MGQLDRSRVRRYAAGRGLADVEAFLGAIEECGLWGIARRPLDLNWLIGQWRSKGAFGSLRDTIDEFLRVNLIEPDPDKAVDDRFPRADAEALLEKVGAAMVLCQTDCVRVPGAIPEDQAEAGLSLVDLAAEPAHERAALSRPVFDPATLGRSRLHNDNEGVVRSYLAAKWLGRLLARGCRFAELEPLLFAEPYGVRQIRDGMGETVAWLALEDQEVASEALRLEPELFLHHGDAGSLPVTVRARLVESYQR